MKNSVFISSDKKLLNPKLIHDFLSNKSYWAKGRALEEVEKTIENSLCFGIYNNNQQIGFSRVVTDKVAFAYIMDFFVIEEFRGKGFGKLLAAEILVYPELQTVNWLLATHDAHAFYKKFGFSDVDVGRYLKRS